MPRKLSIRDQNSAKLGKMADKMLEVSEKLFAPPAYLNNLPKPTPVVFSVNEIATSRVLVENICRQLDGKTLSECMTALDVVKLYLAQRPYVSMYPVINP